MRGGRDAVVEPPVHVDHVGGVAAHALPVGADITDQPDRIGVAAAVTVAETGGVGRAQQVDWRVAVAAGGGRSTQRRDGGGVGRAVTGVAGGAAGRRATVEGVAAAAHRRRVDHATGGVGQHRDGEAHIAAATGREAVGRGAGDCLARHPGAAHQFVAVAAGPGEATRDDLKPGGRNDADRGGQCVGHGDGAAGGESRHAAGRSRVGDGQGVGALVAGRERRRGVALDDAEQRRGLHVEGGAAGRHVGSRRGLQVARSDGIGIQPEGGHGDRYGDSAAADGNGQSLAEHQLFITGGHRDEGRIALRGPTGGETAARQPWRGRHHHLARRGGKHVGQGVDEVVRRRVGVADGQGQRGGGRRAHRTRRPEGLADGGLVGQHTTARQVGDAGVGRAVVGVAQGAGRDVEQEQAVVGGGTAAQVDVVLSRHRVVGDAVDGGVGGSKGRAVQLERHRGAHRAGGSIQRIEGGHLVRLGHEVVGRAVGDNIAVGKWRDHGGGARQNLVVLADQGAARRVDLPDHRLTRAG